jgi:hypothetical protein
MPATKKPGDIRPMLTIVISACLVADPKSCKDYTLPVDGDMDTVQCALIAPPFLANWQETHPQWTVKRWKCQPATMNDT